MKAKLSKAVTFRPHTLFVCTELLITEMDYNSEKWEIIYVNDRGLVKKIMTHPYIIVLYNQNKGLYKEYLMIGRNDHEILCK